MPLYPPELLTQLFEQQPQLTLELLHRLSFALPAHSTLQLEPELLPELAPSALVLSLRNDKPVLGIIVDVQLELDTNKRYSWPHHVSALRERLRCPVLLCVVTPKRSVARWAATPIRLGGGNVFQATVIGPAAIPAVLERTRAQHMPELAVLSAIVHGRGLDHERAARIADSALHATTQLEPARAERYAAVILGSLSDAARKLLPAMDPGRYEPNAKDWSV